MPDIAYLDIIGGVSGDMLISAMLDAGLDKAELERELAKIVPGRFHLEATNTTRGSISATHVDVVSNRRCMRINVWAGKNSRIASKRATYPIPIAPKSAQCSNVCALPKPKLTGIPGRKISPPRTRHTRHIDRHRWGSNRHENPWH